MVDNTQTFARTRPELFKRNDYGVKTYNAPSRDTLIDAIECYGVIAIFSALIVYPFFALI
jgi:hypothetical protein